MRTTICLALALCLAACGTPETEPPEEKPDAGIGNLTPCEMDASQRRNTLPDWEVTPGGEAASGFVCPRGDIDHFWFEVSVPRTIVEVSLRNNTPMSPVDLCYDIYLEGQDKKTGGNCDHDGMDGVSHVEGAHYLEESGTYFLEVRDESGDDHDPQYPYLVGLDTLEDPDTYEPNNSPADAKPLRVDPGFISFQGDEDWYLVDGVRPGDLVVIELTTSAPSGVDPAYTLFHADGVTPVNAGADPDGRDEPTALRDVLPVTGVGPYYLRIADELGDETDTTVGYTVRLEILENPDVRDGHDADVPNNGWASATPVESGQLIDDAYLASRGDEDWYRITWPDVDGERPALIEIELAVDSHSPLDPAVDLIYADPQTPCTAGDACDELVSRCGGCGENRECQDAQCPSHECFCESRPCNEHQGVCRGAGMCLTRTQGSGCGIRSVSMHGAAWSLTGSRRHLHSVVPMLGDTYYILVRDFQSDEVDLDKPYELTVQVHPEPDANEPDGLFLPYLTDNQEASTREWNQKLATPVDCALDASGLTCGPITGHLSYRGDQDWFRLRLTGQEYLVPQEPEPDPLDDSVAIDWDIQFDWSYATPRDMRIGIALFSVQDMGDVFAPGEGTWGDLDDPCSYFCGESMTPAEEAFLWVYAPGFTDYDQATPYTITIKGYRGCPQNCPNCLPDATEWPCPTPENTDPWP